MTIIRRTNKCTNLLATFDEEGDLKMKKKPLRTYEKQCVYYS